MDLVLTWGENQVSPSGFNYVVVQVYYYVQVRDVDVRLVEYIRFLAKKKQKDNLLTLGKEI